MISTPRLKSLFTAIILYNLTVYMLGCTKVIYTVTQIDRIDYTITAKDSAVVKVTTLKGVTNWRIPKPIDKVKPEGFNLFSNEGKMKNVTIQISGDSSTQVAGKGVVDNSVQEEPKAHKKGTNWTLVWIAIVGLAGLLVAWLVRR